MDPKQARDMLQEAIDRHPGSRVFFTTICPPGASPEEVYTVSTSWGTDCLSAFVAEWSRSEELRRSWPIEDPRGQEVLGRHTRRLVVPSLPERCVLTQRFVVHSNGFVARYPNRRKGDLAPVVPEEVRTVWRDTVRSLVARGAGCFRREVEDLLGSTVLIHPLEEQDTFEVAFFTVAEEAVRRFSWDCPERDLVLSCSPSEPGEARQATSGLPLVEYASFLRSCQPMGEGSASPEWRFYQQVRLAPPA